MSNLFTPNFLLKNRHVQTLYASIFRKIPNHTFDIEKFELSDGDFIECYWYNKRDITNSKPIVLLFHGLTGSYKSPYILGTMRELDKNGYDSVVVHFRSSSGVMNIKANSYHSGKTDDAMEFIKSLQNRYTDSKIFAVGYSLGGNVLLKLLGETADASPITAAVSVSAPLQLDVCSNQMSRGFSRVYQHLLLKDLNRSLEQKYKTHDMKSLINLEKKDVKKLSTFWEFDDAYTAPIHGFASAQDYYTKSSSKQFLKHIKTNTLLIHSIDDPFTTPEILPKEDEISPYVKLEIYQNGGHVGFLEGTPLKPKYWLEERIINYFHEYV
ncbi:hydrolase, alpha/beta fold family [Sulfurimonas gotlandica GD1]|uniref:Hydrolase, alpha/beta fold family n=1 Tax=Sulfurimonas gotlandica (strain DSM 19862 / JCM 16533 / GD1) TaxID=929558 RepID=B6BGZ8_SULGG|nr:hydrolase [Sulfurimonas gotlandica]EDZ63295.1 alpha/beta hydrolase fold [Sulfurimonas gotlandica GD1]EHP29782.1 hydrolase, alpha/beta fold family [Sulfurimonas gotlandica GD1]